MNGFGEYHTALLAKTAERTEIIRKLYNENPKIKYAELVEQTGLTLNSAGKILRKIKSEIQNNE